MPEQGRYGGFCLHAPRSPSTYTAIDVYSSTYHPAAHALVQSLFLCRAGMYSSTCVGTCQVQCWDFHFYDSPPSRGASDPSPGEPLDASRSPRWSWAPVLSPSPQRAPVWGGRGANPRPGEANWSSGVAAAFWVCYTKKVFERSIWTSLLLLLPMSIYNKDSTGCQHLLMSC